MVPAAAAVVEEMPDFPAVVTSRKTEVVPAEFSGRVERVTVFSGQRVKAGDPIVKLDDSQLKSDLEGARNNERAARSDAGAAGAQAYAASQQLKRDMRRRNSVSLNSIQQIKSTIAQGGAASAAASARADGYKSSRLRLEQLLAKAQVTSPIDGIAMMVTVKEGEMAQPGTALARIFDTSDLIVKFAVPKEYRQKLAQGGRVELKVDGVDRPIWATITRVADEPPPITFSVVEADIDDSKLKPDEIQVTAKGRVRIAEAPAGGKR